MMLIDQASEDSREYKPRQREKQRRCIRGF